MTLVTETLSIFDLLTVRWVTGFWIAVLLIGGLIFRAVPSQPRSSAPAAVAPPLAVPERLLLAGCGVIVLTVGLIAAVSPPNNYDSMFYHLPRVMHWIQNRSVRNFPTHTLANLNINPWAEYAILQFQILSGGDRFANLVQWFSMVGSVVGVSALAARLGLDRRGQILSAVIAATIPIGILEASSTQTDYAVTFWLVCFVYFLLRCGMNLDRFHSLAAGAALGLCLLTKGTGYIYAFPFFVPLLIRTWRGGSRACWKFLGMLCGLAVILNLGYYARNMDLYQNVLSPLPKFSANRNNILGLDVFLSNVLRNVSTHLALPFANVLAAVAKALITLHRYIGIAPDDPRTTYPPGFRFHLESHPLHEDYAGNFLHFILIGMTGAAFLLSRRLRHDPARRNYFFALVGVIILLNVLVKWTPWISRYHLPIFVLFAPLIVAALPGTSRGIFAPALGLLLLIGSFPWVFYNQSRGLLRTPNIFSVDRIDQYFTVTPEYRKSYFAAARVLQGNDCRDVGLILKDESWEYPLWVLLKKNGRPPRIEHVNVENLSGRYPLKDFVPCAVVDNLNKEAWQITVGGRTFKRTNVFRFLNVFVREEVAASPKLPIEEKGL